MKENQPIHLNLANPSPGIILAVGGLVVFVLFLVGLSVALTLRFIEPTQQMKIALLVIALPVTGLAGATFAILRNARKLARNPKEDFWELMLPEDQRRKLNAQVRELAEILGIENDQISDLRAAYILAEDLALRQIEQEKQVPLKRHITVGGVEFDAVFLSRDVSTFVEVTFLVTSNFSQEKINAILEKVETVKRNFEKIKSKSKIRLMLLLVTQLEPADETNLRSSLAEKFTSTPVDVDIRLLDFEALQRIFTED